MVKTRFSSLDVSASLAHLRQKLLGLRLANIYDLGPKTFLFKFALPDIKEMLLIESGVRCHTTTFQREKTTGHPSQFVMKLRKHIRTRRLAKVDQIGTDRIVDLQFGEDEFAYHVIVEMYASGNIILTDDKYRILALLRIVSLEQADNDSATAAIQDPSSSSSTTTTRFAVGELYPMKLARQYEGMTREKLVAMLTSCLPKPVFNTNQDAAVVEEGTLEEGSAQQQQQPNNNAKKSSKTRKKLGGGGVAAASSSTNLKKLVRQLFGPEYGPSFCDHCLLKSGLSPSLKFPGEFDMDPVNSPHINSLLAALQEADVVILETMRTVSRGYIMSKTVNFTQAGAAAAAGSVTTDTSQQKQQQELAYVDFHPYLFTQFDPATHPDIHITTFDTFDAAVDEYFSKIETQRQDAKARQLELTAQKKIASLRAGHETQVKALQESKEHSVLAAEAIEANLPQVEALILTMRGFIANGMDWLDLAELIKEEAKNNNPLARMVAGLKLDAGRVSCYLRSADVVLDEYYADQDEVEQENEDEEAANQEDLDGSSSSSSSISDGSDQDGDTTTTPHRQKHSKRKLPPATKKDMVLVDIDIYESAYANAHRYFDAKKTAVYKQEKTVEMATKVLKVSEKKIIDSLKAAQQTTVSAAIVKARKPFWFEKYLWFISSENYLVVGGRDAIQNEALVKKHLNKGDVYVHADLHGASSVIVKNPYTTRSSSADDGGGDGVSAETNPDDYNVSMLPPPAADGSFSISPITLHQAGTMSVCMSKAWDSKIVTSAWWVESDQVSKTAPSGEYLTTGSFMVRGKKNWLPPVQLVYGFGIMFKVDESSIGRHLWERRPWARGMLDESGRKINNNSGDKNVATSGDIGSGHDVVLGPEDGDDDQDVDVKSDDQGGDIGSSAEDVSQQKKSDSTSSSSSVISEPGEDAKGEGGDQDGINDISDEVEDGEDDDFEFPDTQVNTMGQVTQASTTTPLKLPPSTSSSSSNDKYNLNSLNDGVEDLDVGDEEGENTGNGGNSSSTTSANMRKYISAKERRQMKKAASKAGGDEDKASTVPAPSSTHNPSTKSQSQSSAQQQQEQKQVRGKKGKQKKMKEKYADQDEEDREQILEFLGSAKGPQPKGKRAKEAARKKEETEARKAATSKLSRVGGGGGGGKGKPAATGNTSTSDVVSKPKTLQTISGGGGGEEDEDNNVSATVYADKKINTGEEMLGDEEKNEIRRMLEEENVAVVDEDQSQLLTYLDSLTGQPHPDDVLMHAIPVCAPWAALSKFKYKVKLLPGSLKKGKASKSAVAAFLSRRETSAATTTTNEGGGGGAVSSSDSSREKDLIRSIPEAELVSAILGKIKVVVTASDAVDSRKSKGGWKKK